MRRKNKNIEVGVRKIMASKTNSDNTVTRQTLYMAILVSITAGFLLGVAYTSFKLADGQGPAMPGSASSGPDDHDHEGEEPGVKEYAARIAETKAYLKNHPEDGAAWATLGNLYFDTNRFAEAITSYEKSLSLKPGNPNVITDLGVMYRRNGEPEKAIQAFDRAVAADPEFETARYNKGIVLMADLNDLPGALDAWEELVGINPMAVTPSGELVVDMLNRMKQKKE